MSRRPTRVKDSIAYTVAEAAHAVSVGEQAISDAIKAGDLVAHRFTDHKRLILADELRSWVASFPETGTP